MTFDPDIVNQGLTLTVIGIGTAFGLLIVMMALIQLMGWIVRIPARRAAKARAAAEAAAAESHDKAQAAVAAVSALMRSAEYNAPNASISVADPHTVIPAKAGLLPKQEPSPIQKGAGR